MGTNYYLNLNICKECKRPEKEIHIGKNSFGWAFALHVGMDDDPNIPRNLSEWFKLFDMGNIKNEYGGVVSKEDMIDIITKRPNGIIRRDIDKYCIANGDGTYDLIVGEFC